MEMLVEKALIKTVVQVNWHNRSVKRGMYF